jgi:hypothetical protein
MSDSKTQIEALSGSALRVLRNAVLRAALPSGQYPIDCSPERTVEVLEPYEPALLSDAAALHEVIRCAYFEGVRSVHADLSAAPGVDADMLAESVEYFTTREGDGDAVRL